MTSRTGRERTRALARIPVGLLFMALSLWQPARAAVLDVVYTDAPGTGFFDDTTVTPLPGNPGTTLGQQRRNVMRYASAIWGSVLESDVKIVVEASFSAGLSCSSEGAVLGGATTQRVFADFPGAPAPGVWYPGALADALAGEDLCANAANQCAGEPDVVALFNANLNGTEGCLGGRRWYYGLDHNAGTDLDFLNVLLHELAHGLGFQTFTDKASGAFFGGKPSIYDLSVLDLSTLLNWHEMSGEQRRASAINDTRVVWNGAAVTAASAYVDDSGKSGGRVMLYAPDTLQPGSSISHWDTRLSPDALMEPRFNPGLAGSTHLDLTPCLLHDLGWNLNESGTCYSVVPGFATLLPSAESLDFGTRTAGNVSSLTLRLENPASQPFGIGGIEIVPDTGNGFQIYTDHCARTDLGPGEVCEIDLGFVASEPGEHAAEIRVSAVDRNLPPVRVVLSGAIRNTASPQAGGDSGNVLGDSADTPATGSIAAAGGGGAMLAMLPVMLLFGSGRRTRPARPRRRTQSGVPHPVYKPAAGLHDSGLTITIPGEDVHHGDWPDRARLLVTRLRYDQGESFRLPKQKQRRTVLLPPRRHHRVHYRSA